MGLLQGYQPEVFFKWFERITEIPRPSFHEYKIRDFLMTFAAEHNYEAYTDNTYNVFMRVPATAGYETLPSVLLQSHTDMITVKDDGVTFDFMEDPIHLEIEGNQLHAKGTTLGADDGSGMAAMLAIADSPDVAHPELELLFTTQEEVGMGGIKAFDMSRIKSRRMINFDSGRVHNICVSSAGSASVSIDCHLQVCPSSESLLLLELGGGRGGHAGLAIHENRACMANLLGELLHVLDKSVPVSLAEIKQQSNAIISCCSSVIAVPCDRKEAAAKALLEHFSVIQKRYAATDPEIVLTVTELGQTGLQTVGPAAAGAIADLLFILRSGTWQRNHEDPRIVEASAGITAAALSDGHFQVKYSVRAIEDSVRDVTAEMCRQNIVHCGFSPDVEVLYPGWPKQEGSPMVALADKVHQALFSSSPSHMYVHGGIEVSFLCHVFPDMDAIAVIPTMSNAHTTKETLYLDQVPDFWRLITGILAYRE